MTRGRHKFFLVLGFILILGIIALLLISVWIVNKAKEIEETQQIVYYSYDQKNTISNFINPAKLITERVTAESVYYKQGLYIASFPSTYFGTLEIIFPEKLKNETRVHIVLSEAKNKNGEPWTRKDMSKKKYGYGISFYEADVDIPKGADTYRLLLPERPLPITENIDSYDGGVLPFCVCSIYGYNENKLNETSFNQIAVHVPFDDSKGTFVSNNEVLNEVFDFCKNTIKSTSFAGIYVDGYRELAPYEADAYINELGHFSVDNEYEIARVTLQYLSDHHSWPTEWILQTISLAYDYYLYTGDVELIREIYPNLQKCLLMKTINKNGLLDSNLIDDGLVDDFNVPRIHDIIDWPITERDSYSTTVIRKPSFYDNIKHLYNQYRIFIAESTGFHYAACEWKVNGDIGEASTKIASPNAVVNAFFYNGLTKLVVLAEAVGDMVGANEYRQIAKTFKYAFQETFINTDSGLVVDAVGSNHTSLHAQIFALDFGLIPDDCKDNVIDFIKSKGMTCSVYASQYLLEAILKNDETQYAINLITNKDERSWYNMIHVTGSKLATEAWSENIKLNQDWNHAWGTAPANIIIRYIVGVRPKIAGCKEITIEPRFGDLKSVSANVPIKDGKVLVNYDKEKCELIISTSVKAFFTAPKEWTEFTVDGLDINTNTTYLDAGLHIIKYII